MGIPQSRYSIHSAGRLTNQHCPSGQGWSAKARVVKKPNECGPPPWPEDMEEALTAQRQWLEKHGSSSSSGRSSLRSRRARLFALGALITLFFVWFLCMLLRGHS
jgi:hypothetical protein